MSDYEYVSKRCRELGFYAFDVRGPCRARYLVDARIVIARELRAEPWKRSYPRIARALGRRNHTTAMALVRGGKRKSGGKHEGSREKARAIHL